MSDNNDNVVKDLYNELIKKRNICKIDLDNYRTEMEIEKKSMEYKSSIEDDSRFFSPRCNDNSINSENDLNTIIEKYEKMIEAKKIEFEYYDEYCKRLADHLKLNDDEESLENIKEADNKFTYSISLNYDINDIKNKLLIIKNMMEISIKIYDNDHERTRQEMIRIDKALEDILSEI